jgi:UDP-N-acetylglucosamine 2-epimerase (non-hydrolysing)
MKIMLIVGARPNFMKAAPIISAIRQHNERLATCLEKPGLEPITCVLIHTGQHYDLNMSSSFFSDLNLPDPDVHLAVGSASHAVQTAEIMRRFEPVLIEQRPELVMVVGDVNSTIACALVTSKMTFDSNGRRPLVAHVEAGLRSFDQAMPEEVNRIITDHLSDMLFVTEESAIRNLQREGIATEKIHFVGNTMIDTLLASREKAESVPVLKRLGLKRDGSNGAFDGTIRKYAFLTLHRPSNVDKRNTFVGIIEGLQQLSSEYAVLFPAHPRAQKRIAEFGLGNLFQDFTGAYANRSEVMDSKGIFLLNPLGYLESVCLMRHAALVVTDSGGIQEETTGLGVPCITVRENTERPVTVTCGTNIVAGTQTAMIMRAIQEQIARPKIKRMPEKWDGKAAQRIVQIVAGLQGCNHSHHPVSALVSA